MDDDDSPPTARRPHGSGTVYRSGHGWAAQLVTGSGATRRRRTVYARSEADVRRKLAQLVRERDQVEDEELRAGFRAALAKVAVLSVGKPTPDVGIPTAILAGGSLSDGAQQDIEAFRRYLRRRELSERTIGSYCDWAVRDLLRFAGERDLDAATLEAWQDSLLARGWKPKSRSLGHTGARAFLRWLAREGRVDPGLVERVERVRTPRRLPRPLEDVALERILRGLLDYELGRSLAALRDRALFLTLLATGARISEALRMPRHGWERALVTQKGGSERWLDLPPAVVDAVREYASQRVDQVPALWISGHGPARPLTRDAALRSWKRLARRFDVDDFTSHQLRHTTATALYRAGAPELVVARHLGHADLSSIHVYAQVADVHRERKLAILEDLVSGRRPTLDDWASAGGRVAVVPGEGERTA